MTASAWASLTLADSPLRASIKSFVAEFAVGAQEGKNVVAFSWNVLDLDPATIPLDPANGPPPTILLNDSSKLVFGTDEASTKYRWWDLQNVTAARSVITFPTVGSGARHAAPWVTNGLFIGRDQVVTRPIHLWAADWPFLPGTAIPSPPYVQDDATDYQTYELGDVVMNSTAKKGAPMGQVCIRAGTGTDVDHAMPATTGTTTAGSTTLAVDTRAALKKGQYIVIPGAGAEVYRIVSDAQTDPNKPAPAALFTIEPAATNAVNNVALDFYAARFTTYGGMRGTVTVTVTSALQAIDSIYETIKLVGDLTLIGDAVLTIPSYDGWSARVFDATTRGGFALSIVPATNAGSAPYPLANGQTQRFYMEYDEPLYYLRPESPPAFGPIVFDPASLPLSGWWRASYGGAPWAASPSAGTSAANGALVAGAPPSGGAPQNGLVPASFDGVNDELTNPTAANGGIWNVGAGGIIVLFKPNAADAPTGNVYDDAALVISSNGDTGLTFSTNGVAAFLVDTVYVTNTVACATGAYHLVMARWDGAALRVKVDGGAEVNVACGPATTMLGSIQVGYGYGGAHVLDGDVLEVATFDTTPTLTDFENFRQYVNARYGLGI